MAELSDPVTLRLPQDILRDVERIAAGSERTRSWVIVRALKYYLAQEAEGGICLSVLRGREEAAEGGGEDLEDVIAELDEIIRKGKAA
ncbi:ribbon-helix-helix domain-containing protein [Devosia sp. BK]|jgi:predicted transcriptional regulator|uniref:ribbon-helix-helix domain-containing protein n=1 Tax=unclassified Devosia TaxID=196773 RepID=UPI000714D43C|nr:MULTISPECIES: ribbon-helix-helix domain-containing protein [unclassified Devosia]KQN74387.1 CopG family transcriptional regulator [Devosia sp. Leaf64]MDV3251708.1 ribbon-helix-helix domain-containing protein [Devosia sp. BK]